MCFSVHSVPKLPEHQTEYSGERFQRPGCGAAERRSSGNDLQIVRNGEIFRFCKLQNVVDLTVPADYTVEPEFPVQVRQVLGKSRLGENTAAFRFDPEFVKSLKISLNKRIRLRQIRKEDRPRAPLQQIPGLQTAFPPVVEVDIVTVCFRFRIALKEGADRDSCLPELFTEGAQMIRDTVP